MHFYDPNLLSVRIYLARSYPLVLLYIRSPPHFQFRLCGQEEKNTQRVKERDNISCCAWGEASNCVDVSLNIVFIIPIFILNFLVAIAWCCYWCFLFFIILFFSCLGLVIKLSFIFISNRLYNLSQLKQNSPICCCAMHSIAFALPCIAFQSKCACTKNGNIVLHFRMINCKVMICCCSTGSPIWILCLTLFSCSKYFAHNAITDVAFLGISVNKKFSS